MIAQSSGKPDKELCRHRYQWAADVHAVLMSARRSRNITGVFYTSHRATTGAS